MKQAVAAEADPSAHEENTQQQQQREKPAAMGGEERDKRDEIGGKMEERGKGLNRGRRSGDEDG